MYEIFREFPLHISLSGITEERLESIGVKSVGRVSDISVVGFTEVLPALRRIRRVYREAVKELGSCDVFIACDAPGFNLRLIKEARKVGVRKVIYFISPQVWAWKPSRARTVARYCDDLVVILPFEVGIYRKLTSSSFRVHYVGHPLVDMVSPSVPEGEFIKRVGLGEKFINLMPGSRWGEIKRHAPLLKEVMERVEGFEFVVPSFERFRGYLSDALGVRVVTPEELPYPSYCCMAYSEISLIASGTASLEAALLLNPHVVFYKVNPLTYVVAKALVRVPHVSLPNLILGGRVVPEVINGGVGEVVREMERLIYDEGRRREQVERFAELREKLGGKGVIGRLRELFAELLTRY